MSLANLALLHYGLQGTRVYVGDWLAETLSLQSKSGGGKIAIGGLITHIVKTKCGLDEILDHFTVEGKVQFMDIHYLDHQGFCHLNGNNWELCDYRGRVVRVVPASPQFLLTRDTSHHLEENDQEPANANPWFNDDSGNEDSSDDEPQQLPPLNVEYPSIPQSQQHQEQPSSSRVPPPQPSNSTPTYTPYFPPPNANWMEQLMAQMNVLTTGQGEIRTMLGGLQESHSTMNTTLDSLQQGQFVMNRRLSRVERKLYGVDDDMEEDRQDHDGNGDDE